MERATAPVTDLTVYEQDRLTEIHDWYARTPGTVDRLLGGASSRARRTLDVLLRSDRARQAIENAAARVLEVLDEQLLADIDGIPPADVAPGGPVERLDALRRADRRAERLRVRYVTGLSAQAAVAGAASLTLPMAFVAMAADVTGAVIGSLRTAGHTLSVYGTGYREDRVLVEASVGLVAAASETDPVRRKATVRAAFGRLTGEDQAVLTADEIPRLITQQTGTRAVKETVEQAIRRIVRRRAVVVVPVLGAAASAAASGWLASRVSEAARHAGAAVFLHRHAGLDAEAVLTGGPAVDRTP